MAKESTHSRIPRLDGVTKIPLPGTFRPPKVQLRQPTSFTGLRTPSLAMSTLKTSLSGDRLSEAASLVGKRTASVVRKFLTKPEKSASQIDTFTRKFVPQASIAGTKPVSRMKIPPDPAPSIPKPLTRSETFVREDGESDIIKMAQNNVLPKQSTPVFGTPDLHMTHSLDGSRDKVAFGETLTLEKGQDLCRTHTLDSPAVYNLTPKTSDCTANLHRMRTLTTPKTIIDSTNRLGTTAPHEETRVITHSKENMLFSPKECRTFDLEKHPRDDATITIEKSKDLISLHSCENLIDISIPALDSDLTLKARNSNDSLKSLINLTMEDTMSLVPDKTNMKLVLNSTMNTERLLDITSNNLLLSPARHLMNITRDLMGSPIDGNAKNNTNLLYMTRTEDSSLITPDRGVSPGDDPMDVDRGSVELLDNPPIQAIQELTQLKPRFSFGLDLTEATLDCSIELCDVSLSSTIQSGIGTASGTPPLKKQNSFEMDESLGILTPDQMKEFLDSTTTTTNLDLPLGMNPKIAFHQMRIDQTPSPEDLPLDPVAVKTDVEDVPIELTKTHQQSNNNTYNEISQADTESKTDQMTKSNVSKISTSFITSVTSVTSLDTGYQGDGEMSRPASRGAGDHSPSNGPTRKSAQVSRQPSFNQNHNHPNIPIRRQDPMTDSDFFTESDADDIFHRGDRRAQVIDGQLYGPMLQPAASVFISEQPEHMEDSCMESSGIFTDVENRGDEDLAQMRGDIDMSPDDGSTDTVKSNKTHQDTPNDPPQKQLQDHQQQQLPSPQQPSIESEFRSASPLSQGQWNNMLTDSQTSSTIQSSFSSSDRISMTTDYNPTTNANSKRNSGGVGENYKSSTAASSNEALSSDTTTKAPIHNGSSNLDRDHANTIGTSVKKVSPPRKHASLSSLCSASAKNDNNNAGNYRSTLVGSNSNPLNIGDKQQQLAAARSVASVCTKSVNNNGGEMPGRVNNHVAKSQQRSTPPGGNHQQLESKNHGQLGLTVVKALSVSSRAGSTTGIAGCGTGSGSIGSPTLRKVSPNKWDAVMNKIAVNKMQMKTKNYSEVKSKVSTGVLRRTPPGGHSGSGSKVSTPLQDNSPTVGSNCSSGLVSPHAKRIIPVAGKRGRSYSKDSQQSSQSDLSLSSGSPKLLAKAPSRAAKKRDVRNLSISPTDLGPPPKAQQTVNGSTRTKTTSGTLSQKKPSSGTIQRQSHQKNHPSTVCTPEQANEISTPIGIPKDLPSRKVVKQSEKKLPTKTPLKDHNRLVNQQQQQQQTNNTSKTNGGICGGAKGGGVIVPSNMANEKAVLRANSHTPPSPVLNKHVSNKPNGKCNVARNGNAPAGGHTTTAPPINKKAQKEKPQKIAVEEELQEVAGVETLAVDVEEQLQQKNKNNNLQRLYSCNSGLDYHRLLPGFEMQGKGIAALGVLLQYLVFDLDAFACPAVKNDYENAKQKLNKTLQLLDQAKSNCHDLQDQLFDKESYYTRREQELQDLHRCELDKVELSLKDTQNNAKDHIASLESQLAAFEAAHQRTLDEFRCEANAKYDKLHAELVASQQQEQVLNQCLSEVTHEADGLREQIREMEDSFTERIHVATQRERELVDKVNILNKQMETLRHSTENRERELENKLSLTQDEISVLRLSRSYTDQSSTQASPRNSGGAALEIQRLQSEAESLRCVLEIKQKEISKLTKQNQELIRDADEAATLMGKISTLESRCEMLQSEAVLKADKEKELREKLDELTKAYSHETVVRQRLSFDKEALQWQLKQRSEQLQIVESKLHEHLSTSKLSISSQENTLNRELSHNSSLSSLNRTNGSDRIQFQMDDVSPPSSPIIKGVIEKHDSVSWVLEMDDETPEAAASKMVKRAGSFRSTEKSPSSSINSHNSHNTRRQLSMSANCASGSVMLGGPNPLSQSMSATSVIRQHSNDAAEFLGRVHSRIRSKSVSVKSEPKKVIRQNSGGNSRNRTTISDNSSWKDPVCASSPYTRNNVRSRNSTSAIQPQVRTPHLITCDTSTLNTGEKLEMRSLPTHSSVHDLKALKKCQEIQESAGEAMVSGTNSEDEGCSASSDEAVSTSSSTGSSSSSLHHKQHMSIDEVLMLDKMHSLNGTPMEVSWSDDPDAFASESTV